MLFQSMFSHKGPLLGNSSKLCPLDGVHGKVEKVVGFKHCWLETHLGLSIVTCEVAIMLAKGMMVVSIGCLFMPEIITERNCRSSSTSKVRKSSHDLNSVDVT
jgi:hypothetical protein